MHYFRWEEEGTKTVFRSFIPPRDKPCLGSNAPRLVEFEQSELKDFTENRTQSFTLMSVNLADAKFISVGICLFYAVFIETKLKQIHQKHGDLSEMVTMIGRRMEECDKDGCREQQMD